jgi:hypothetical protein
MIEPGQVMPSGAVLVIQCGGCRVYLLAVVQPGDELPLAIDCECGYRTELCGELLHSMGFGELIKGVEDGGAGESLD